MIRIGIDAYPLVKKTKAGIGYYTQSLLNTLLQIDNTNKYYLYNHLGNKLELPFNNVHSTSSCGPAFINKFSTLWMLFSARKQLLKDNIDIFWGTQSLVPPPVYKSVKTVLTIHDLTYYKIPETMAFDNYCINRLFVAKAIRNVHRIITDSATTANDIKERFNDAHIHKKISVVYAGIDSKFKSLDEDDVRQRISGIPDVNTRYILFVGTIEPRKNIPGLLKAFKLLKTKYNIPHQLLVVGAKGWKTSRIEKIYNQLSFKDGEVIFPGYVSEEDLVSLYCGADVFVMPSFYEGFGIPPLEAMACGTPVVASDIPIFREILDDAAFFTDSASENHLAETIYKVLTNSEVSNQLIEKGYSHYKKYSWKESAKKILEIFEKLAKTQ